MMLNEDRFFKPDLSTSIEFECQAYILKKIGRHTLFTKYRPQFYFRTADVTGGILPSGTEMVMPGDDGKFTVKLITIAIVRT